MNLFCKIEAWFSHVWNIVEHQAQQDAAVAAARGEIIAQDADHSRIVAALRAEYEAAVSDLKQEIAQLRKSFDAEAAYCRSCVDWLEVSKRDAANFIAIKPQRPTA